jgi:hypothetical protein
MAQVVVKLSLTLTRKNMMRVSEHRMPRKGEAVTEEWRKLHNEQHPDCDPHQISFG